MKFKIHVTKPHKNDKSFDPSLDPNDFDMYVSSLVEDIKKHPLCVYAYREENTIITEFKVASVKEIEAELKDLFSRYVFMVRFDQAAGGFEKL